MWNCFSTPWIQRERLSELVEANIAVARPRHFYVTGDRSHESAKVQNKLRPQVPVPKHVSRGATFDFSPTTVKLEDCLDSRILRHGRPCTRIMSTVLFPSTQARENSKHYPIVTVQGNDTVKHNAPFYVQVLAFRGGEAKTGFREPQR